MKHNFLYSIYKLINLTFSNSIKKYGGNSLYPRQRLNQSKGIITAVVVLFSQKLSHQGTKTLRDSHNNP